MTEAEREDLDRREAEIEREAQRKFAETLDQLTEWAKSYKPAEFDIEQAKEKARKTPEMRKLQTEIKELEMINGIFEGRHIK